MDKLEYDKREKDMAKLGKRYDFPNHGRKWTLLEDYKLYKTIIDHHKTVDISTLAAFAGRTPKSVAYRLHRTIMRRTQNEHEAFIIMQFLKSVDTSIYDVVSAERFKKNKK